MTRQAAGVMWLPWSRRLTLFLIKHPTTDTNLSAPLEDISSSPHLPQLFPSPSPSTILFISALQLLMTHALQPPAPNDASQLWCQCGVIHHDGDGEGGAGCWAGEAVSSLCKQWQHSAWRVQCPSAHLKCAPSFVRAAAEAGTRCPHHHHPRLAIC